MTLDDFLLLAGIGGATALAWLVIEGGCWCVGRLRRK